MQRESLKFAPRLRRPFPLRSLGLAPSVSLPLCSAAERFVSLRFETRTRTERGNARIARPILSVPPARQTASETVFRRTATNVRLLRNCARPSARFQPFVRRVSPRVCSRLLEENGQGGDSTDDKITGATRAKKGRADSLGCTFAVLGRTVSARTNSSRNLFPASRRGSDSRTGTPILWFRSGGGPFASIGSYRPARSRRGALLTLKPSLRFFYRPTLVVASFSGVNPRPRFFRLTSCSEARCDRRTEEDARDPKETASNARSPPTMQRESTVRTRFARSIFSVSAGWTRLGEARGRADASVDGTGNRVPPVRKLCTGQRQRYVL